MPNPDPQSTPNNLAKFHRLLAQHFSLDEFRTLCFDLRVNFDDLGGEGISGKARELILVMGRLGRFSDLQRTLLPASPKVTNVAA